MISGHCETERLGGLEADHKRILGRRLHRKVSRLLALENTIDVACRAVHQAHRIDGICDEPAGSGEIGVRIDGGQTLRAASEMMRSRFAVVVKDH
jgi:hypothetical protein